MSFDLELMKGDKMISIKEIVEGAKTVAITGHVRPDGDCTGSALGLYNYLCDTNPAIEVDVYLEPIEEHFMFFNGSKKIKSIIEEDKQYDVFFVLDCGDPNRVAEFIRGTLENAKKTVCIDHHVSYKTFADINHIQTGISSTCEVIYELMEEDKISKNTAECLYTGIIHDTGVLKYQSTTKRTMYIAGELMDKGIDFTSIVDDTFFKKTYVQNKLLGKILMDSRLILQGKAIYSYVDHKTLAEYNLTGKDLGGVIDQLRFTEGIEVAIFMYELSDGLIKGSLRSVKSIDVNIIANEFGGGGHIRAAGFSSTMKMEELISKIQTLILKQL